MRVVHLVHNFPPEFVGGTERYVSGLVRRQQQAGLDVSVISGSEERGTADHHLEQWHGIEVHRIQRHPDERYGVLFRHQRPRRLIEDLVRRRRPDLVHLHHWFNLADTLVGDLAPLPVVGSFHDSYAVCPRFFLVRPDGGFCGDDLPVPLDRCVDCVGLEDGESDLAERLRTRRESFADEVSRLAAALVPSRYQAELLAGAGLRPREGFRVLPLGIEPGPEPGPREPGEGRLRVACFGHLSRLKGIDLLLDAVRGLGRDPPVEVHLFGGFLPGEEQPLRAAADGLPVTFHGRYEPETLARAAARIDLVVFPSRARETYSLVVEEAIWLGLPMVVSDRGAPPERVEGFGRVVAVEDAQPLRRVLQELAEQPRALARMQAALPERAHLLGDHVTTLSGIYREALSGHEAP